MLLLQSCQDLLEPKDICRTNAAAKGPFLLGHGMRPGRFTVPSMDPSRVKQVGSKRFWAGAQHQECKFYPNTPGLTDLLNPRADCVQFLRYSRRQYHESAITAEHRMNLPHESSYRATIINIRMIGYSLLRWKTSCVQWISCGLPVFHIPTPESLNREA